MSYVYGIVGAFLVFVICINVLDTKRRSKLTEEQRLEEDEQQEIEKRIW
jgi:hypothetical protein